MSVSLICWGRFFDSHGNKTTVPAPPEAPWLWDFLAGEANTLAAKGFQRLQLPPASKAQGGSGPGCDGYGLYDPRDLGTKLQQGSTPTRYGNADSLRRLIAIAHANGLAVDLDIVLHQLAGGEAATYRYLAHDPTSLTGRGSMHPGCFRHTPGGTGTQPQDDVPAPAADMSFGDEKVYQHSTPAGYTISDALDFGDWLFRTTGADGARIDDVKGLWPTFVANFLNHGALAAKPIASEFFDGDPAQLDRWATTPPLNNRSAVIDYPLHFALRAACNTLSALPLQNAGYAAQNPALAHTFVDNPDTDTSPGQQVVTSKLLAYAYLLTIPCQTVLIYGKDYFSSSIWPGAYGLQPFLENLVYINRTFAYGNLLTRWLDDTVIVLERDGNGGAIAQSHGLLTALNFDTFNRRPITCQTSFGPNTHLHDYTGTHPDIWTDSHGQATFTIPANAFARGQSYLCFSRAGADIPVRIHPQPTTQTFFGADDLDIPPTSAAKPSIAGRIFVEADTTVQFRTPDKILPKLLDGSIAVPNKVPRTAWYTISVATRSKSAIPYQLTVTYQAPQTP